MTTITGRWRVTIIWWSWWALSTPESSSEGERRTRTWGTVALLKDVPSPEMRLTGCGYEVEETFFREQWVFQPSKIQLQHASHRVDVVITLIIHQRVLTCAHVKHSSQPFPDQATDGVIGVCLRLWGWIYNSALCLSDLIHLCICRKWLVHPLTCDTWALYMHSHMPWDRLCLPKWTNAI